MINLDLVLGNSGAVVTPCVLMGPYQTIPLALKLCWDLLCVDRLFLLTYFFQIMKIIDGSSRKQSHKRVEHRRIHLQNLPVHLGMQLFLLPIQTTRPFQIMTGLCVFNLSCTERGAGKGEPAPRRFIPRECLPQPAVLRAQPCGKILPEPAPC